MIQSKADCRKHTVVENVFCFTLRIDSSETEYFGKSVLLRKNKTIFKSFDLHTGFSLNLEKCSYTIYSPTTIHFIIFAKVRAQKFDLIIKILYIQ